MELMLAIWKWETILKKWTKKDWDKNTPTKDYFEEILLEYLKIKLFGVAIILIYHLQDV